MDTATAQSVVGSHGIRVTTISTIGGRDAMEDAHAVHIGSATQPVNRAYVGVFDGHGGCRASKWAAKHLHEYVLRVPQVPNMLQAAFEQADEMYFDSISSCCGFFRSDNSGTTAAVATLERNVGDGTFTLTTAHCGDSRVVTLDRFQPGTQTFAVCVGTVDHKPSSPTEIERITKLGGEVRQQYEGEGPMRVEGYLSVSRSLGDFAWKRYICPTPDVSQPIKLTLGAKVLLACDGLFDVVTNEDVAWLLANFGDDPCDAVERLRNIAVLRGSRDNITIALIDFVSSDHQ